MASRALGHRRSCGGGLWGWLGGLDGPIQVLTFRHARGWEVESLIGSILWGVLRMPTTVQSGAFRVGSAPLVARAGLLLIAFGLIYLAWRWATRGRLGLEGVPTLTSVSLLMAGSAVVSHQYLSWLLPWTAIAGDRTLQRLALAAGSFATGVILSTAIPDPVGAWSGVVLLLCRNAALVAIAWVGLVKLRRSAVTRPETGRAPGGA